MSRRRRPPNGSPAQRMPFGEEKQGSGRGMPARAFRDKADFASTTWPFLNRIQVGRPARAGAHCAPLRSETHPIRPCGDKPPQAAPNGSPAQRVPFGEEKQGSGRGMPPRVFRDKADFASTSWPFSNRIQAGRPTRAGAHCAPLRSEAGAQNRILSAPAGDKPPQGGLPNASPRIKHRRPREKRGASCSIS